MARSRLFTTLVLMGASLTGAVGIATVAATTVSGCSSDEMVGLVDMQSFIDAFLAPPDLAKHIDFGVIIDMAQVD
jgi:hypothetical protein